ncbi:MAG: UvrD-helicase domain-containing protein [Bacteroidales bacterium]|nr:UvrD-helicase domain-containing protein [Bacteroidales bacterium]
MILDGLNTVQRQAVEQTDGPIMIIAGAGSGKTRTLTYKIAYLLQQGVSPFSIIALTFTNKAAKEMQERIIDLVGIEAKGLLVGTFHSIFSRILRMEAERLGYTKNYTIYDDDDSKKLIVDIVKSLNLDEKQYKKGRMLTRISYAKSALYSPEAYATEGLFLADDNASKIPLFYKVYAVYQKRLFQNNAMDFDDILFNMNVLLRDYSDVREKYQRRFKYILVDEYQDTNYSQYHIIKVLADFHKNICVVGDDAQSIYSFRGANISNILNFNKDYPNAKTFKLEQNYRSTENIINAANEVIAKNEKQIPKTIWTDNPEGEKITYRILPSDREEADWVGKKIQQDLQESKDSFSTAILYRTNSQSRTFEDSLRLKNIPYIIYNSTSFYARKEIKNIIAYLRLVVNNSDDEAFERIVNYPARGIGATTMDRLKIAAQQYNLPLFHLAESITPNNPFQITPRAVSALTDFCLMIKSFTGRVETDDAYTLGKDIINRSGIKTDLALLKEQEDKDRLENVEEFLSGMQSFVETEEESIIDSLTGEEISIENKTLDVFLQQISLMTSTDVEEDEESNKVKLMTIHSAKGLEFDNVYVVGMEENLFPSTLSFATREDIEEERRLFYVAITRARKNLILTSANMRFRNGSVDFGETSRFVREISQKYLNIVDDSKKEKLSTISFQQKENNKSFISLKKKEPLTSLRHNSLTDKKSSLNLKKKEEGLDDSWHLAKDEEIEVGVKVHHSKFGYGTVTEVELKDKDKRAHVDFGEMGQRVLILKFAKLKIQ